MTDLNQIRSQFEDRLDYQRAEHKARLEQELNALRAHLLKSFATTLPGDLQRRAAKLASAPIRRQVEALVDISGATRLQDLDEAFIHAFDLGKYYQVARLRYPTVYCETLEEFFAPLVKQMDLSSQARQIELARLVKEAQEMAAKHGGGIFGYNLPGTGAYLNGWLFTYGSDTHPSQAFNDLDIAFRIYGTAAHEKLGHGFLSVYSALGEVKTRLGLTQVEMASRFGMRSSDDPTFSLRREQSNMLFLVSQLLEEGWATWLETAMVKAPRQTSSHSRYSVQQVIEAVQSLPIDLPEQNEVKQALLGAILLLFEDNPASLEALHQAVMVLEVVGGGLDDFLSRQLGQPLRYAVGDLIMVQAEANLGAKCVPYAALIAANVTFDPATIGLTDLRDLLGRDPRLHPDARMAALSRLKLDEKNNVFLLTDQAANLLSLAVPKELR